ncbi:MAG: RluA family pseudouridine synthase [Treponema sp.]|nr:RluA family pseudouridine synthase [Treponema sp.]
MKIGKDIDILFENDDCLILNKPAGLAVQGGKGVRVSLDSLLAESFRERPLLVHRLDRDTSGVILAAKRREAAARFSLWFSLGKTGPVRGAGGRDPPGPCAGKGGPEKIYLAVSAGLPQPPSGTITQSLEIRGKTRPSATFYRVLSPAPEDPSEEPDYSFLELELGTGRMHQIRRHLSRLGNPVLGDDKYGNFTLNKKYRRERGLKRLLLHAFRLIIPKENIDVRAPLPPHFDPYLDRAPLSFHD